MKCVGIQQLEAMRELMEAGEKLERTVFISFQPDEEIGGMGLTPYIIWVIHYLCVLACTFQPLS